MFIFMEEVWGVVVIDFCVINLSRRNCKILSGLVFDICFVFDFIRVSFRVCIFFVYFGVEFRVYFFKIVFNWLGFKGIVWFFFTVFFIGWGVESFLLGFVRL